MRRRRRPRRWQRREPHADVDRGVHHPAPLTSTRSRVCSRWTEPEPPPRRRAACSSPSRKCWLAAPANRPCPPPAATPCDITHVNAHGTSTALDDAAEARAVRRVFGASRPLVTSIQGAGHSIGAAGALAAVAVTLPIDHETVPRSLDCPHRTHSRPRRGPLTAV
ncbi:hypothetical protein AB0F91_32630 [Amycolatopsis sp. NPDC023774]|uniref:hypothetical protein n=1 Tax=Amycolatopsis sp. NPDC023774 TaxID=3155015 RepID=UPI0033E6FF15